MIAQLSDGGMRDSPEYFINVSHIQNDIKVTHINEIYGITKTTQDKLHLLKWVKEKDCGFDECAGSNE